MYFDVARHHAGELFRGRADRHQAHRGEALLDLGQVHDSRDFLLEAETIAGGVFAGAKNAVHTGISASGTPASAIVGTSGQFGWRCADVTASPRIEPAFSGPAAGAGSTIVIVTWPAISLA